MDVYNKKRQKNIIGLIFGVILTIVAMGIILVDACAEEGDSSTELIQDGYEAFPLAFRCPDEPHPTQTCEPGKWYFGTLIGDGDYDDWIGAHASANKFEQQYLGQVDLLASTKKLMQDQLDAYKVRVTSLEADVLKNAKLVRWNSTVAFISGSVIFTALTIAITAIVYHVRNDIEETMSNENGIVSIRPMFVGRFP